MSRHNLPCHRGRFTLGAQIFLLGVRRFGTDVLIAGVSGESREGYRGDDWDDRLLLKPTKVNLFKMILYNFKTAYAI